MPRLRYFVVELGNHNAALAVGESERRRVHIATYAVQLRQPGDPMPCAMASDWKYQTVPGTSYPATAVVRAEHVDLFFEAFPETPKLREAA